ncbi:MAG TPA: U32 family peptidase [Candidatus Binataceae bacterium]|nr:U32 family peptidase [Candidatus Binataceae bacterium]
MKLMLPTNFDPELIGRIARFEPVYIYGSLPTEATLRSSLVLAPATEEDVAFHIEQAARRKIRFAYVMNATCLGNKEYSEEGRGQLLQRLQWLVDAGGAAVVTANPFVMELVRENFPSLELHISVLASVNDARKAKFFDELGATVIHLDPQVNRDFRRLEAIRKAAGCTLSLVVNEGCLLSCPIRNYHSNMISHSGESITGRYYVDYCYYRCALFKVTDPAEHLRSPWVRPEDLSVYEDLGIDLFKVAGREKMEEGPSSHTDWIVKVAGAYHARRCDDVARLLVGIEPPHTVFGEAPEPFGVRIESAKLDGFLRFFQDDHCLLDCNTCDYCGQWANRAVRVAGKPRECAQSLEGDLQTIRVGSYRSGR